MNGHAAVVIVANSPGEIAGWVRPLVASLRASEGRAAPSFSGLDVIVVLPPCPFASGREAQVASAFPGVDAVVTPREYVRYALFGAVPEGLQNVVARRGDRGKAGIVVHLGGDPMHSALLARKLRFPAVAYSDRTAGFVGSFARFMAEDERVKDKLCRKGVRPDLIDVVGNLMVDGVRPTSTREAMRAALGVSGESPLVCLMPGSRTRQVLLGLPFLLRVAEIVRRFREDAAFVAVLSPFVSPDAVSRALASARDLARSAERHSTQHRRWGAGVASHGAARGLESTGGDIRALVGCVTAPYEIETDAGARVKVVEGDRYAVMAACDVAASMPGTVTAELGFLGVPTVVIVPTNLPEHVPLPGALGVLGGLPLLGGHFKRLGVRRALERIEFAAIPNRRQRRMVTPEVRGALSAEDVAIKLLELLHDEALRGRIAVELRQAMGQPGAADRAAAITLDALLAMGGRRR